MHIFKFWGLTDLIGYMRFIPKIIGQISNWHVFFLGYFNKSNSIIRFRNGLKLKISDLDDVSSISVIFFRKEYGEIQDNSIIVDVGANKGYFSMYAAMGRPNVIVYCFEPIKTSFDIIQEQILLNNFNTRINPFNMGMAGDDDEHDFFISSSISNSMVFHSDSTKDTQKIQCISLKKFIDSNKLNKIDLLKMDCEGAEFDILYNTPIDYLSRIQEIRMEYHNNKQKDTMNIDELSTFLKKHGFKLTFKEIASDSVGIIWFQLES